MYKSVAVGIGTVIGGIALGLLLQYQPRNLKKPEQPIEVVFSDPKVRLDTPVKLPEKDAFDRTISSSGKNLIVYGGVCSSCNYGRLDRKGMSKQRDTIAVIVFDADHEAIRKAFPQKPELLMISSDSFADPFAIEHHQIGRWILIDKGRISKYQRIAGERP